MGATVAKVVISKMVSLKTLRKHGVIGRKTFLKSWGRLRAQLAKTKEYREFRKKVCERSGGKCAECRKRVKWAGVVHHVVPVAWDPTLSLTFNNVQWLCNSCHALKHPWLLRKPSDESISV